MVIPGFCSQCDLARSLPLKTTKASSPLGSVPRRTVQQWQALFILEGWAPVSSVSGTRHSLHAAWDSTQACELSRLLDLSLDQCLPLSQSHGLPPQFTVNLGQQQGFGESRNQTGPKATVRSLRGRWHLGTVSMTTASSASVAGLSF